MGIKDNYNKISFETRYIEYNNKIIKLQFSRFSLSATMECSL